MKIAIDVSQLAYQNTGVANYLSSLVEKMVEEKKHEFVLFYSSLRIPVPQSLHRLSMMDHVSLKTFKLPPSVLNIMWNTFHLLPFENFVGNVDIVITSDWTEPPVKKAKKVTILYDLIVYKYPKETSEKIVSVQKRKLEWVKKESNAIFCISEATRKDAIEILKIDQEKLRVIYPGF